MLPKPLKLSTKLRGARHPLHNGNLARAKQHADRVMVDRLVAMGATARMAFRLNVFSLGRHPIVVRIRQGLRESEAALIALAATVGLAAGVLTNVQSLLAHGLQQVLYGVTLNRLSALGSIHHPWRLVALPIGGAALALITIAFRQRDRVPIDVVEANALHGGRIPLRDSLMISCQTILSNGCGASVGLEAAYAQIGGGIASLFGQGLRLRRADLRTLVGAGAGAAVGAAFGAPLTGAFYAFEIVIGAYSPAAIAPVAAAALAATFVTRTLGVPPYLIASAAERSVTTVDYLLYAGLGIACAVFGIIVMRLVTQSERVVRRLPIAEPWRPLVGGLLLIPIALVSPQSLSAGHGALHLDLVLHLSVEFLAAVLFLKLAASVVSLSFGFRGGLFFASLFMGALFGQLYAELINAVGIGVTLDVNDAALVGMAALSVSIIGGPMTLSLLILETTHDFSLTAVVITAALVASAFTRERFGYSFSTWRLHVRGSAVRSPRDIGWMHRLTARSLMRLDPVVLPQTTTIAEFRLRVPLGSTSRAIVVDDAGGYCGMVFTAAAFADAVDVQAPLSSLAVQQSCSVAPTDDIAALMRLFDDAGADDIAVVDATGQVLGVVTEKYVRRRYLGESEAELRRLFGE